MQLDKLKKKELEQLFAAVLALETIDECYLFFDDLCTINEMKLMIQRLEVAKMLQAKQKYNQIEEETGASTATISRVKRCLEYGQGGYSLVLDRMKKATE